MKLVVIQNRSPKRTVNLYIRQLDNNLTLTMANGAKGSKVQPLSEIRKIETKNIVSSLKKVDLKYILALI